MTSWHDQARAWLSEDPDPATRRQLQTMLDSGDEEALAECFAGQLEFGTAGLRGVLGPGPNRMNRALVRRVTSGLGRYLLETIPDAAARGVVLGYDARHLSPELASDTAEALAGLGIKVHLFEELVPTPLVAFAVGDLDAAAGVMITASHNPPEYNGYKVYWENGAQIIPPHDRGIARTIDSIESLHEVLLADLNDARAGGLVVLVSPEVREHYLRSILALQRHSAAPRDLRVVYTALHGVGGDLVRESLGRSGLLDLFVVLDQMEPDGDFPTVRFPNPEEEGALDLALERATLTQADLILANDPDADRLAVALREDDGGYRPLTGDQIGSLLGYYLLTENLPGRIRPLVMTTIVSSRLLSRIAADIGARYAETLTGFKWIANVSQQLEASEGVELVLGYEEALGYSVGMVTPDKDGISAALLFVELAAVCKAREIPLWEYLEALYRRFGFHLTRQYSTTLPGQEGAARIASIMDAARAAPPERIGDGPRVVAVIDYLRKTSAALVEGVAPPPAPTDLPSSNVLSLLLEDESRILLRPSGTEPKIKSYFELVEPMVEGEGWRSAEARAMARLDALRDAFLAQIDLT